MNIRPLLTALALTAALVPLAACGSSSSGPSGSNAGAGGSQSGAPSSQQSGSSSDAAFCAAARRKVEDVRGLLAPLMSGGPSKERLRAFLSKLEARYREVIAIAPAEIEPSVAELYAGIVKLDHALRAAGYDALAAAQAISRLETPRFRAAAHKLSAWAAAHCAA